MKFTEKWVNIVSDTEFEKAVAKFFGMDECEIVDSPNDTSYYFSDVTDDALDNWDMQTLEEARRSGTIDPYSMGVILNALAVAGEIEKGNYLIRVSW